MQTDGNFVLYSGNTPRWQSCTPGHPGAYLVVWYDGRVSVMASNGSILWISTSPPAC
jgi:hypothetical protein